jgi:hypothetical protein
VVGERTLIFAFATEHNALAQRAFDPRAIAADAMRAALWVKPRGLYSVGPPFARGEESRLHRRARLDAVYFHLYGLNRDEADYVLSTFRS